MADVRCPMCSKPNPAGAETCQHCHARLKPLVASSQPTSDAPKPPSGVPDSSDWLGNLRSDDGAGLQADSGEAFDGGEGDWFSRLGQEDAPAEPKPDWLAAPMDKGDPNIPDWMEDLGISNKADDSKSNVSDQDDLKNWLAGLSSSDDTTPPDAGGNLAWLSSFGGDDTSTKDDVSASQEGPGENLPDWLSSLGADESAGPVQDVESNQAEPASALPDWLTAPGGLPETGAKETSPVEPPSGLPDWLSGLEAPDLGASTDEPVQSDTFPSWLSDSVGEKQEEPLQPPVTSDREPPTQPIPDWLSQFEQVAAAGEELPDQMIAPEEDKAELSGEKPTAFSTGSLGTGDLSAFGTTPDWLSDLGDLSLDSGESAEQPAEPAVTTDWLSGLGDFSGETADQPPSEPASGVSAFVMSGDNWSSEESDQAFEMPELDANPDWLSNVTASEATSADEQRSEATIQPDGTEATLAELPTWLESMRPVGAAAPTQAFRDETDSRVESAGPLTGLRGVLQAEPEIANFRKPPVYVNKLQVTEAHQAHIALLEELVSAEGKPKPVQAFVPIKSQIGLRLLIAISLIGAIFFGLLWGRETQLIHLSDGTLPVEIINLRGSIEALRPGAPVLVAVDYEAGTAVEMDYPARLVLQNLEQKEAFIAFASTSLNGPLLSERLLRDLDAQSGITYTNYTMLGYLPGGASGLLSFARAPKQTLLGVLDGDGWGSTALSSVNLLSDFALVVVMTDNADTARLWVEQVRPYLDGDTPLLMVLSAQAEPMVRPYFTQGLTPDVMLDPNQVQISGYVAGMAGAAAYQSKLNPLDVLKEWDALTMASLVAIVLIALGGMANMGLAISSRPKSRK